MNIKHRPFYVSISGNEKSSNNTPGILIDTHERAFKMKFKEKTNEISR